MDKATPTTFSPRAAWLLGLRHSLPIVAGYLPIAFAFGVAAVQAGLPVWMTVLISVVVYAGGAQFVLISLLSAGGSLWTVAPAICLLNARHVLYGPAVLPHLQQTPHHLPAPLLAHGLTDEAFATIVSHIRHIAPIAREYWIVGLQLGAYLAWNVGTVLGCFTGAARY